MAAGSAKASLSAHFAKRGNVGELSAVSCSCSLHAIVPDEDSFQREIYVVDDEVLTFIQ